MATKKAAQQAEQLWRLKPDLTGQRQIGWDKMIAQGLGQSPGKVLCRAERLGQGTDKTPVQNQLSYVVCNE